MSGIKSPSGFVGQSVVFQDNQYIGIVSDPDLLQLKDQTLDINGYLFIEVKTGATQVAAGAAAGEIWATDTHATLPDNVLMIGV